MCPIGVCLFTDPVQVTVLGGGGGGPDPGLETFEKDDTSTLDCLLAARSAEIFLLIAQELE